MKNKILNIFMILLAATTLSSCSVDLADIAFDGLMDGNKIKSVVITGIVTDAQNGEPLKDIRIYFQAYPQNTPDAPSVMTSEVYTNKNGIFTIDVSGEIHESLLCTLTATDTEHVYESKTNQVIITWSGTSYDKSSGKFVVNDCSFQMTRATASGNNQQSL